MALKRRKKARIPLMARLKQTKTRTKTRTMAKKTMML
jgi:hypothetical protein